MASQSAASHRPSDCDATPSRALFMRSSMARKPRPFSPRRTPSAPSKTTSQVAEPWMPSFRSRRVTRTPLGEPSSRCRGTSRSERPLVVPFDSSKVSASRASTRCTSAPPFEMKIFWPSTWTEPSGRSVARAAMAPRSLPAWGSVRSMLPCTSPETKRGSHFCLISSLPNCWMSLAAPVWRPTTIIRLGSAREIISK